MVIFIINIMIIIVITIIISIILTIIFIIIIMIINTIIITPAIIRRPLGPRRCEIRTSTFARRSQG